MIVLAGLLGGAAALLAIGRPPAARRPAPRSRDASWPAPGTVAQRRSIAPLAVGAAATAMWLVAGAPAAVVGACGALWIRRWRRLRRKAGAMARRTGAIPEMIETLVVLIDAGCAPTEAVRELSRRPPPELAAAIGDVVAHLDVGVRLAEALTRLTFHVGEPARVVVDAITRAEVYGEPLAPLLLRLHDEAVRRRRLAAETAARQLTVRLCFPLVSCTLPAFTLLTIVPLLAGAFSSLSQSHL